MEIMQSRPVYIKWQIAGAYSEIVLDFVLLACLERLHHPSLLSEHQVILS